jgi:hypothetical protein
MELNDEKSKLDLFKTKVDIFTDLNGILDNDGESYFSRDWIADLLGFNKHIIRKEKINKIYEQ